MFASRASSKKGKKANEREREREREDLIEVSRVNEPVSWGINFWKRFGCKLN